MGGDDGSSEEMELRPRFPLMMCKDYKIRRVRHWVSRTPENYMRHFYKCKNHGTWKGVCDMWKWEDEYEEFLKNGCEDVQDQSVGSSSMRRTYAGKEKKEGIRVRKKHLLTGGSSDVERNLEEIIWLLKCVLFSLWLLVFLMFVYVIKH
ncbi:unnamed protein product [Alopecurus aequalis]